MKNKTRQNRIFDLSTDPISKPSNNKPAANQPTGFHVWSFP